MNNSKLFRWWFYVRTGYQNYYAFLLMGINTLTVTYFLAIENVPFLKVIFPSFTTYVVILLVIGLPLLVWTGYVHFKRVPGYGEQVKLNFENNPYYYKLPHGYWKNVVMPYYLLSSKIMMKIALNEKISENEKNELLKLQKDMEHLNEGGYVGLKGRTLAFGSDTKEN